MPQQNGKNKNLGECKQKCKPLFVYTIYGLWNQQYYSKKVKIYAKINFVSQTYTKKILNIKE